MKTIQIANGVTLNVLPSDKFKTNLLSVNFITPLNVFNASNAALLSKVLLRASNKYPSTALLSKHLEYLYDMSASMRSYKRGETLIVSYESEFLKDGFVPKGSENLLYESVDLFYQVIFEPLVKNGGFDENILCQEKSDLINSINALINNKNAYAKQVCTSLMCGEEAYSTYELGDVDTVNNINAKSLYEYYLDFVRSTQIEIYFVGEADEELLTQRLKGTFEGLERQVKQVQKTFVTDKVHSPVIEKQEPMDVSQGKLALGFRTGVTLGSDDSAPFALFCEIFGGSPVSKLFLNVREKLSLCYYCRAMTDSYKGVMFILSGIENSNREKAVNAILCELEDMKCGKFSDEDIESAVLSLTNAYKELSDNTSGLVAWYLSRRLYSDFSDPNDVIERIKSVSKDSIVKAASKARLDTIYFLKGTQEA